MTWSSRREGGPGAAPARRRHPVTTRRHPPATREDRAGRQHRPRREHRPGGGLAMVAILVQTLGTTIAARGQPLHLDLLGYALLAVGGMALADRLRVPRTSPVLVAAATVAYQVLDYPHGPTFVALIIAAASGIKSGHRWFIWALGAASYTAVVVLTGAPLGRAVTLAAWGAGVGLLIEAVVAVAGFVVPLAREQQRLQEERKRRQASDERLRIAQELHDVLGHHLSLINVRAGVGLHLMSRQPEQAQAALDAIQQTSAEALREVQSVLNVLYPSGQAAPRAPAPGLDRLAELTSDAGLPVHTTITGEVTPLPAEIDRAAYRIVQEALTNVRRHAGPGAAASIMIDYRPGEFMVVQVEDDGGARGPVAGAAAGNGIGGMRERAAALGGSLAAGPRPGGGWRVRAELPLPGPEEPR
jgi:signal transduction histidine kinase